MKRVLYCIGAATSLVVGIIFVWALVGGTREAGARGDAARMTQIIVAVFCFSLAMVFGCRALGLRRVQDNDKGRGDKR